MTSRHIVALFSSVLLATFGGCGSEGGSGVPGSPGSAEPGGPLPESESPGATAASATDGVRRIGPSETLPAWTITPPESPLHEEVDALAQRRAEGRYAPPRQTLPRTLNQLTYDQYRAIPFRPEEALWRGEALFEIGLFHPGYLYRDPVTIHLVEGDRIRTLDFETRRFRYEGEAAPLRDGPPSNVGHAGFRVHYPLNGPASRDEVVVFLGDSYFRLLGPGHVHGLSSRGVAVDTGLPSGEEFPAFREFWLVRPEPMARSLTFFALLDSPSLTGAFRFDLHPGGDGGASEAIRPSARTGGPLEPSFETDARGSDEGRSNVAGDGNTGEPIRLDRWVASEGTVLEVDARFYARKDVAKLGVAPLTSMFLFDGNTAARFDDFRPRVHDSHGLLALTGAGEWIWRPLSNGPGLRRVSSLRDRSPKGFGLVQRERDFGSYLDLEARYDRRPSEWVDVVEGHWGSGGVDLVEIPSESEFNDNVVAFWAGDAPFRAGEVRHYRYRLVTFDRRLPLQTLAQVERTRIGWDALPGEVDPPPRNRRRFVVDFVGGVPPFEGDGAVPEAVLTISAGKIPETRVQPLPDDDGWRVTFTLEPDEAAPADLRLYLERAGQLLSETWTYVWYPERSG